MLPSEDKNKEEKSIDEILYLVKEKQFDVEKIKKDLDIDIKINAYYNEKSAVIEFKGQEYDIETESRMITFHDGKEIKKRFVRSYEHLNKIVEELGFKAIIIPCEEENSSDSDDSLGSEINKNELLEIFLNESITQIKKDKTNLEKIIDKFKQRYSHEIKYILNLSLNASIYYPNKKKDDVHLSILKIFHNKLSKFFVNDCNILYLVGPKGTSKSLFLINYCFEKNKLYKKPLLYINYRVLKESKDDKKKNLFKKEFIYLFFDENALKSFYNEKAYETISKLKLMQFIYDFVQHLINIFENTFNEQLRIVIDNFDEDDKEAIYLLQNLINLIKQEGNRHKVRLILSGKSQFIYDKLLLYFQKKLSSKKPINQEMLIYYNIELNESKEINIENNDKVNDMNSLPLYYFNQKKPYSHDKMKDILIKKEEEFCKKYNAYGMYYSIFNERKKIKISDLANNYTKLPLDYLVFKQFEDDIISFKFHNEIFKSAVKKSIEFSIQHDTFIF